jgi:Fe-S-cluster-containing hydrogenase component 2
VSLQGVYHEFLKKPADDQEAGPIRILAYLSSGDILGEMGVVRHALRTATCIAWDHPTGEEGRNREPGQVHLISIKSEAFDKLMQDPLLAERVEDLIQDRKKADARFRDEPVWQESSIVTSPEFQDQGFIQGQKLMLIDLDSCTRCGDCVRACIETHDDGYSRLFLDGPRFDRFLVPSACRNCIDPACMIGCPVGSIQKGDQGQIVIRDWCIGCNKCANQCPYDSIQMHDTGVIPSRSPGWKFQAESAVKGLNWYEPRYKDAAWSDGFAPFQWDLDLHAQLKEQNAAVARHKMPSEDKPAGDVPSKFLQYRDTVLEVRMDVDKQPPAPPGQESFDPDKLRIKALPAVAVVCDQCSTRKNGVPACVEHCPHEAAMRINARVEFPIGMKEEAV